MGGMDDSFPSKLQVWTTGSTALLHEWAPVPGSRPTSGPPNPAELAERLYLHEAMAASPRLAEAPEPFTLQWFLEIENQRHGRNGRWIPRILEFAKHTGETLLGVGDGLGTDWLQYARHGASVIVSSPSVEQLQLIRRNFEQRGLEGRFHHAPATALPVEANSIDVVCVSSLLQDHTDARAIVDEVYRVLKPGGKVLALVPAKYDVDCWFHLCFPWQRWLRRTPPPPATSTRYSARGLRRLFGRFTEHRVYKRHLRRAEIPHVWRWVPPALLARLMGRLLVIKAFKPLSAAMTVHIAA
jgi:ubiquinone/menaquinone biosynthesis C-methylase UbiE